MAIAFVKHIGSATGKNVTIRAVGVPAGGVAIGNVLVVRIYDSNVAATVSSILDSGGNSYGTWAPTVTGAAQIFLSKSLTTVELLATNSITVTMSAKGDMAVAVDEFSGLQNVEDGENTASGTSTTPSAAFTPTYAADLIFSHLGLPSGSGDSFTEDADTDGGGAWNSLTAATHGSDIDRGAYKITTSAVTQTYNPTLGASRGWLLEIASLVGTDQPSGVPRYGFVNFQNPGVM